MNLQTGKVELDRIFEQARQKGPLLDSLCQSHARWGIYGAGRTGRKAAQALRSQGKHTLFFIDQNSASAPSVDGLPSFPIDSIPREWKALPILVAIHNSASDSWKIKHDLLMAGFRHVFLLQEAMVTFGDLAHFWLDLPAKTLAREREVREGLEVWADDESRAAYCSILAFRLLGETCPGFEHDQYFPATVPPPPVPLRWIDCGAFNGDTIDYVAARGIAQEWVAAFEPDPGNYRQLAAKHAGKGLLIPCGVSNKTQLACFSSDGSASSLSGSVHDASIQLCRLDDAIGPAQINFVKMDIEGAELDALDGARELIARCQPRLAIASYHAPSHLWEVAKKCREVGFQGQLMLRIHALNTYEVVTYGIEPRSF